MTQRTEIQQQAKLELARREFWDYCTLKYPTFYREDRHYLKEKCNKIQEFIEQSDKRFLIISEPPRHGKSFTGKNLTEWLFGLNNKIKVMTGSYNETLSSVFAAQVRDTIAEDDTGTTTVYSKIFNDTRIKYGEASAKVWALEGSNQKNYLATSPTGTATGFGANVIVIDDIIKNSQEAYNQLVLDKHWDWLTNTMMQRTEGEDWKVIIIMTRWSTDDLAGRVLKAYPNDVVELMFKAVQDDGSMLCESILSKESYAIKTKEMNRDIAEANYNQKPIDVKGRLYKEFKEYDELPSGGRRLNYTDTADKGIDWLCSVDYILFEDKVYILDVVMSNEGMEHTEPEVARMLHADDINEAYIEANNGGRGFGRNVKRELKDKHNNNKVIITDIHQTANKEARILTSSGWVKQNVYMPYGWARKHPDFYDQIMTYQTKAKNKHDDAVDVLAGIYDQATSGREPYGDSDFRTG